MSDNRNKDANDCNRCIVVVGGGVAGSSCVQVLADRLPDRSILLINPSRFLKVTANVRRLALNLEQFDVHRVQGERHVSRWSNVRLMADRVVEHDPIRRIVRLQNEAPITYDRLVIATGARPKRWSKIDLSIRDFVVTLRDEKSVQQLQQKLASCRTVLLLGNGGIATELAHAMRNVRTVWLVRDATINTTFLDATTARFFELKTGLKRSRRNESDADQSGSERDGKWHPMHRPGSKHDADENNDGDSDQSTADNDSLRKVHFY